MLRLRLVATALGVLGFALTASAQSGFKIIAHPSVSTDSMSASEISDIFMKKTNKWPDGTATVPVDQMLDSSVRARFSEAIHGKSAGAVDAYWQKRIFSGRGLPPVTQGSSAQVVAYVRANPGAIGYVSSGTATAGVKVIALR